MRSTPGHPMIKLRGEIFFRGSQSLSPSPLKAFIVVPPHPSWCSCLGQLSHALKSPALPIASGFPPGCLDVSILTAHSTTRTKTFKLVTLLLLLLPKVFENLSILCFFAVSNDYAIKISRRACQLSKDTTYPYKKTIMIPSTITFRRSAGKEFLLSNGAIWRDWHPSTTGVVTLGLSLTREARVIFAHSPYVRPFIIRIIIIIIVISIIHMISYFDFY